MKIATTLLLLCFSFLLTAAQTIDSAAQKSTKIEKPRTDTGHNFMITIAFHSGTSCSYELSFSRGHSLTSGGYPGYFNQYGGGIEVFHKDGNLFFAPKIAYELDPFLPPMCLSRMNLLYVTDFKGNASLKYRHEIGFSFEGGFNINYGYTFNLTN